MKINKVHLIYITLLAAAFFVSASMAWLQYEEIKFLADENKNLWETTQVQQSQITDLELSNEEIQRYNEDLIKENIELTSTVAKNEEEIRNLERTASDLEQALAENKIEILSQNEYSVLAKLLCREAGAMSWDGMVYTCSAILNLSDYSGRTIMEMAHDKSTFSVAPVVDSAKPTERVYQVIDYVLQGHRVPDICYFRTNHYHSFGVPVCEVGGHYFSRPK